MGDWAGGVPPSWAARTTGSGPEGAGSVAGPPVAGGGGRRGEGGQRRAAAAVWGPTSVTPAGLFRPQVPAEDIRGPSDLSLPLRSRVELVGWPSVPLVTGLGILFTQDPKTVSLQGPLNRAVPRPLHQSGLGRVRRMGAARRL